jgi:hypothetical protein
VDEKIHEAYTDVSNFVSSIESEISKIKSRGIRTARSDELIRQARTKLGKNNLIRAKELAKDGKRVITDQDAMMVYQRYLGE